MLEFLPFILMALAFYVLILMPNQKKQKAAKEKISKVKKGDKVVTIGGIIGIVDSVDDETVSIKIDDKIKIKMRKTAIAEFDIPNSDNAKKDKKVNKK
ncbi:MAG: preprotein translocase subunit YajC [Planctomycetota bacterium]|nr:MAG: preprotein translocase subunit YajC [Planctomycetota bacterium]